MKKIYFIIFLLIALFIVGCTQSDQGTEETPTDSGAYAETQAYVIEITSSGFNPSPLTVKQGTTVTWVNKNTVEHWPASAKHPTHTVYPGSDIQKCGMAEESNIFDACRGLKQNEGWTFTFNEKGEWAYHDHLDISKFGKIIVE